VGLGHVGAVPDRRLAAREPAGGDDDWDADWERVKRGVSGGGADERADGGQRGVDGIGERDCAGREYGSAVVHPQSADGEDCMRNYAMGV
jgi:hypothetical protein